MKVNQYVKPLRIEESGQSLTIAYSNRGEPFREGVEFTFDGGSYGKDLFCVLLSKSEVERLIQKLTEFVGSEVRK